MNHDYAHCWDYEKGVCPEECFRAKLTDDLRNWPHPVTYSKFKGTEACPLTRQQPKRTHGDKLRSSTDVELAWAYAYRLASCYGCEASTMEDCAKCTMEWLRQEAEEGAITT